MNRGAKFPWNLWYFLLNFQRYSLTFWLSVVLLFDSAGATPLNTGLQIGQQSATTQQDAKRAAEQALGEGLILYKQGTAESLRQAILKWKEAVQLWQQLNDLAHQALTLTVIGKVYDNLGEKQKALEYLNQALPIERAVGDKSMEASTLNNLGAVYSDIGEKQKALEYLNQALSLKRAVGDKSGEASTLNNLGKVYNDLGERQKALENLNQALPLVRAMGDKSMEATTLNNLGKVYNDLGEKKKALENLNQALSLKRAVGDKSGEAATLNNLGLVYNDLGEKYKVLEYLNQALPLVRAVGNKFGEAVTLNNLGAVYDDLGKEQKALEYFNQALPLERAVGDKFGEATTLNNFAHVYDDLGEKQKALGYFNQALSLRRAVSDKSGEAVTLNNLGLVYSDLGEKQKALEYFNQALPLVRLVGDKSTEAATLNNLGLVYSGLGEKQKALEYYNQVLPLWQVVGDRGGEATTLSNIGKIYLDTKQPIEAIKTWEKSVRIILQLRGGVGRENRKTFLESKQSTPIALVDLLIKQNQPEQAFQWANLATVADLADYSRLVNAKVANPEAQKALAQWNQKNLQLNSLQKQLQQKFSPELSQRVNQLQGQLNQQAENIRNRFPEAADLFETKPTDISQLQASIPVGTTVIQPVFLTQILNVPKTVALFILTRDKLTVKKIPVDPAKFDAILIQTYTFLTNRFDDKYDSLEKLYDLLIRPIEAEIQATNPKQLSFIVTGKLRYIPFEALYDGKTDKYLIQKYPISYLTRLSTRSLKVGGMRPPASTKKVLAFGNPVPKEPLELRGSEEEVKSITRIFPGSEAYINSQATLDKFKIQSPRFSLLHLATHGCFQKGGCPKLGLKENTLLFADQMYNIADAALLGLQNVDLITLSACQTALETNSNGEEIAGLAYLFERAGSRSVIASLWSADDETTKAIMTQFYQNLKKGMSKGEALRQAKLSQINNDGILPHPFFWSPFVLIGDAG
ncbi:tetratricopeptide repeat protein [Nostocaceae cyanobacterium CENA369]|uniref:Tetratricopeptide repeat protein n=1 Tax=Dendronalium phyllosphericum CENA369 TaxID=1725256 RepID=A0A8J7I7U7_9NOST|nr:tetratricopeptide repeat protein [Dendronalium phyllosphericum]MBH8575823.1 tetratricopeptide repeat protein [Dendronalium phyllosphericum CENA369]